MKSYQFRIAARTDAAGKYNSGAPLEGNEDNLFVDINLSDEQQGVFTADEIVDLSDKGCLMVVADGMGGMNAGEVASDIAIKTVMEYFKHGKLTAKVVKDAGARIRYMEDVVLAADAAIKEESRSNPDYEGMGSTIILAWLCNGELSLTWCGDSRAYLFRPSVGLGQVSKDHSYVQDLVDEGAVSEVEAFDHPYGNIVTRSLGDPEKKAKPESRSFPVYKGDIIMLCSDGLSGVLRDRKTFVDGKRVDTENLEDLIRDNARSLAECRDVLFDAAQRNEWYDNVTLILCEVVEGDALPADARCPFKEPNPFVVKGVRATNVKKSHITINKKRLPIIVGVAVLLIGLCGFFVWMLLRPKPVSDADMLWANCKKYGNAEMYREYMKLYPEGTHIDSAKLWLERWKTDSVKNAAKISAADTSRRNESSSPALKKETSKNRERPNQPAVIDTTLGLNPPGLTPVVVDPIPNEQMEVPENPIISQPTNPLEGEGNDPEFQEEKAYEKARRTDATLEDMLKYLENGDYRNPSHRAEINKKFKDKCFYRINREIKTMEQLEEFEKYFRKNKGRGVAQSYVNDIEKKIKYKREKLNP